METGDEAASQQGVGSKGCCPLREQCVTPQWLLVWRAINGVMFTFFILAALVNINDPDPYIWIPIYGVAAILVFVIVCKPSLTEIAVWRYACVLHMVLCVIAAVYLAAVVIGLKGSVAHRLLEHEEARECLGVLIVAGWLALCRFSPFNSPESPRGRLHALLLMVSVLGLSPLVLWSACYWGPGGAELPHCVDMILESPRHTEM